MTQTETTIALTRMWRQCVHIHMTCLQYYHRNLDVCASKIVSIQFIKRLSHYHKSHDLHQSLSLKNDLSSTNSQSFGILCRDLIVSMLRPLKIWFFIEYQLNAVHIWLNVMRSMHLNQRYANVWIEPFVWRSMPSNNKVKQNKPEIECTFSSNSPQCVITDHCESPGYPERILKTQLFCSTLKLCHMYAMIWHKTLCFFFRNKNIIN